MLGTADDLTVRLLFDTGQGEAAATRMTAKVDTLGKMAAQAGHTGSAGIDQQTRALARAAQMSLSFGGTQEKIARAVAESWRRTTNAVSDGWNLARTRVENAGKGIVSMLVKLRDAHKNVDDSTREFAAHMREFVENPMRGAGTIIENAILSMGKTGAVFMAVGAGIAIAARELFEFVKEQAEAAHQMELLSVRTGLTIKEAQQYSAAAKIEGVDINSLTMMIRGLSQAISENGDEGKRGKRALADLGLVAYEASGQMKGTGALLHEIATKMSELPEGARRTRLAMELLNRSGVEFLPMLTNVKDLDRIMKDFGIPPEKIRELSDANKEITKFSLEWQQLKMLAAADIIAKIKFIVAAVDEAGETIPGKVLRTIMAIAGGAVFHPIDTGKEMIRMGWMGPNAQKALAAEDAAAARQQQEQTAKAKPDTTAGDALYAASAAARRNTLAGTTEALEKAKEELKKAEGALGPGKTLEAQRGDQEAVRIAQQNVNTLERRLLLMKALPEAEKRAMEARMQAEAAELTGLRKLEAERKRTLAGYETRGENGELISTATPKVRQEVNLQYAAQATREFEHLALERRKKDQEERQKDINKYAEEQRASDESGQRERNRALEQLPRETEAIRLQTQEARLEYGKKVAAQERDARIEALQEASKRELSMHSLTQSQKLAISLKTAADELAIENTYLAKAAAADRAAIERKSAEQIEALKRQEFAATDAVKAALEDQIKAIKDRTVESTKELMDTLNADTEQRTRASLDRQADMIQQHYEQVYQKVKGTLGEIWDETQRTGGNIGKAIMDTLKKTAMGAVKDKVTGMMADMIAPLFGGKHEDPAVTLAKTTSKNSAVTVDNTNGIDILNGTLGSLRMSGGAAASNDPSSGGGRNYGSLLPGFFGAKPATAAMALMSLFAPGSPAAPRGGGGAISPAATERAYGGGGNASAANGAYGGYLTPRLQQEAQRAAEGEAPAHIGAMLPWMDASKVQRENKIYHDEDGRPWFPTLRADRLADTRGLNQLPDGLWDRQASRGTATSTISFPSRDGGNGGSDIGIPAGMDANGGQSPTGIPNFFGTSFGPGGNGGGINPGADISDANNPYSLNSGGGSSQDTGGSPSPKDAGSQDSGGAPSPKDAGGNSGGGGGDSAGGGAAFAAGAQQALNASGAIASGALQGQAATGTGGGDGITSPQGALGFISAARKFLGGGGGGQGGGGTSITDNWGGASGANLGSIKGMFGQNGGGGGGTPTFNPATGSEDPGAAFSASALASSPMAGAGGMMLLQNGLQRNNALGMGEDIAGGALVGMQYGGPIGAAVGAGVGAIMGGLRWSGAWQTFAEQVKSQVHKAYGLVIDAKTSQGIAKVVQEKYYGNIAMGIRSPEILAQLQLYAKATGQNFPLQNTVRPLYLTEVGGHMQQAASYDNGKTIGFQSGMQNYGGQAFNQTIGQTTIPNNPGMPGFATGGVVNMPTIARVGEREPEAIIPLSRMRQAFGPSYRALINTILGGGNMRLPTFGGGPIVGAGSSGGGGGNFTLSLDGKSSAAFLQGQTVDAISDNPRVVQTASLAAAGSSWGRQEQAALLTEPGTILS